MAEKISKKKDKKKDFQTPYTVKNAVIKGGFATKLSMLIMGFGNMMHKQFIKGFLFLVLEVGYVMFMIQSGISCLSMLPSLGDREQIEVYNEAKGIYEYVKGDDSLLILLFGDRKSVV